MTDEFEWIEKLVSIVPAYRKLEQGRNRAVRTILSRTKGFQRTGNYTDTGRWQADAPKRKCFEWPTADWSKLGRPRVKFTVNGQEFEWCGTVQYQFKVERSSNVISKDYYFDVFPGRKDDSVCLRVGSGSRRNEYWEIADGTIEKPPVIQSYWAGFDHKKVSNHKSLAKGFHRDYQSVYAVRPHQLLIDRYGKHHIGHFWWDNARVIFGHIRRLKRVLAGYGHFTYLPWYGHLNYRSCALLDVVAPNGEVFRIWHWKRNKMSHVNNMNDQCVQWAGSQLLTSSPA